MMPEHPVYNIPRAFRLKGEINTEALRLALEMTVKRHESLRTTFDRVDNAPRQVICPAQTFDLSVVDVPGDTKAQKNEVVSELVFNASRRPFNLGNDSMIRATLFRLDARDHVLFLNMHHIASDGWSLSVLLREIEVMYQAKCQGRRPNLEALPIQYADYAVWQRQQMQGEHLQDQLEYWKGKLAGELPALEMPTDHARGAKQTFDGALLHRRLPSSLAASVREFALESGVTPFMVMLASFKALIHRYTGQEDVIVGTPIAGRNRAEIEHLIGFFVNTLALRTPVIAQVNFEELVDKVSQTALEAYQYSDVPFEKLVEVLQPDRSLSHPPVFQVWFAYQNTPPERFSLDGVDLCPIPIDNHTAKFDLSLHVQEADGGLTCTVEYNTDLWEEDTINRFLKHYQNFLSGALCDPSARIGNIPVMDSAERSKVLSEFNDTAIDYSQCYENTQSSLTPDECLPPGETLPEVILNQVQRTPHAEALRFRGRAISYRELHFRMVRWAKRLRAEGVSPNTFVGVCLERSDALVCALLATMESGGAFVPIDPSYPRARLQSMIDDAALPVLITSRDLKPELTSLTGDQVSILTTDELDDEGPIRASRSRAESRGSCSVTQLSGEGAKAAKTDLAYMIYTSGSTGKPKGALNHHGGIVNRLRWMQQAFGLESDDRVLQKTPASFDVSVWEFFWPLMAGATLVIAEPEGHKDPGYLADVIEEERITTLHFVPSMLRTFLEQKRGTDSKGLLSRCSSLRRVICSGESLPPDLVEQWAVRAHRAGVEAPLYNLYGPTEAAIDVTWWPCPTDPDAAGELSRVPIGSPVANTQVYVLDDDLRPMPIGVPGELYIGGVQVGSGYWNRRALTRERFIPDPYESSPRNLEGTMYRTGDWVRWLPNGTLEFLGRTDFQVKVRGVRVELGEIESALMAHRGLRDARVLVREDTPEDQRITAYIVPEPTGYNGNEDLTATQQIADWEVLYDETYSDLRRASEPTFNTVGWNSSYSGDPIPDHEMKEWVEHTAERIRSLNPRDILEIGCGTGLLFFPLAADCASYYGTDLSSAAINYLKEQICHADVGTLQVTLEQRPANQFDGVPAHHFDTVVLNSVLQYFPSGEYLLEVLDGAMNAVRPGGAIFIGDVRSLPLLEAFYLAVERRSTPDGIPLKHLKQRVSEKVMQEEELVINPAFFDALQDRYPSVSGVEVHLKRGEAANEMTQFRYDVILHVQKPREDDPDVKSVNWSEAHVTHGKIQDTLSESSSSGLRIKGVPNAHVTEDVKAAELLLGDEEGEAGGNRLSQAMATQNALTPEAFYRLGDELGYNVEVRPSSDQPAKMTVTFWPAQGICPPSESSTERPLSAYTNRPLFGRFMRQVVPDLRRHLSETLPEYMIPANFVLMESLPLLPNGKLDRSALPAPGHIRRADMQYVAPKSKTEELLAGLWAELIGVDQVGRRDNFFDLGGHSLLATQVISKVRDLCGVELPIRALFEDQTLAAFSDRIETLQWVLDPSVPEESDWESGTI